jgi:hypothetical protein
MSGGREVPALLRSVTNTQDEIMITKVTTVKEGYMLISDFESNIGVRTAKVFPSESAAHASSYGERILKVKIEREL